MFALIALVLLFVAPASGATLQVGPDEAFARPSQAVSSARPGDRIVIAAGRYVDCAVWRVADLTIQARANALVEITGPICQGKALFVTAAPGITVQGITFTGARAVHGNGAGIRAEGGDLTVRAARFIDNQNGILANADPSATITIEDSLFRANGALEGECAHGIYVGGIARLIVRESRFEATRVCHHLKSRAARTEITGGAILDTPDGNASYLIDIPDGGDLLLSGTVLRKGPRSGNPGTAVMLGAESRRNPTRSIVVRNVAFESLLPRPTVFMRNLTAIAAMLEGNQVSGAVVMLEGPGTVR